MKWSKMENRGSTGHRWYCSERLTTYHYRCETWLYDKQGEVVGGVERWVATSGWATGSIYRPFVYYNNDEYIELGKQDSSLKECKALVLDSYQRLHP